MAEVFLGIGSNLGDRAQNLAAAATRLAALGPVVGSSWYETDPVDMPGAAKFLNCVVKVRTDADPREVLDAAQVVELQLGRNQVARRGPRTVDIDVLLYDGRVVNEPGLRIPHPGLHRRAFVLVPLAELAPDLVHPLLGRTVRELLADVSPAGVAKWPPN
jgi:2-amino-4-hydroxy-6-hydroxymethyldihydropteridine diphosphokinase